MVLLLILVDVIKNASDDIGDGRVRVFGKPQFQFCIRHQLKRSLVVGDFFAYN